MKPISDDELRLALEGLRPRPNPAFAAELDARAAAGFPRPSRWARLSPAAAAERLRGMGPAKILLPAGAVALTLVLVVAVVVPRESRNSVTGGDATVAMGTADSGAESGGAGSVDRSFGPADAPAPSNSPEYEAAEVAPASQPAAGGAESLADSIDRAAAPANGGGRAIERSSDLTLATTPERVGRASSEVFDVVHDYRGVVLRSRTSDGNAARAEAQFELLIPSGKVGDAMAAFSRIAEVRSRHEATTDITAPTVTVADRLEDSRARIDSLLGQLAAAETEGEREAVEGELRGERRRAAALQASLANLERRAELSRVSLRIVGGEGAGSADEGGAWGIGDALDDAGRLLGVAAAVSLLVLAVLAPLALIALLVWLARRPYLRRARRTALG